MKVSGVQGAGMQGTEQGMAVPPSASVNSVAVWEVARAGEGSRRAGEPPGLGE